MVDFTRRAAVSVLADLALLPTVAIFVEATANFRRVGGVLNFGWVGGGFGFRRWPIWRTSDFLVAARGEWLILAGRAAVLALADLALLLVPVSVEVSGFRLVGQPFRRCCRCLFAVRIFDG